MDKTSRNRIASAILIALVFFGLCYLFNANQYFSSPRKSCQGTFINESSYIVEPNQSGRGGGVGTNVYIKLDSGETIQLAKFPTAKALKEGDRVNVRYHRGKFFGKIYESYELVNP